MGLFDLFTGDSVKDAADANKTLYEQNKQEGLGYLDTGYSTATGALDKSIGSYSPLVSLGQTLTAPINLNLDALGVNGPAGNARATAAFTASPGYNFQRDQGLEAIDRGAASRGMLTSGNTIQAEQKYGSDLADQEYNNWRTQLGAFTSPAITATAGGAYGTAQGYNSLAALGETDAQNRTNLATTTTSGLANANMQAAQAEMQGSGNLFNFGLNTAKLISGWGK